MSPAVSSECICGTALTIDGDACGLNLAGVAIVPEAAGFVVWAPGTLDGSRAVDVDVLPCADDDLYTSRGMGFMSLSSGGVSSIASACLVRECETLP